MTGRGLHRPDTLMLGAAALILLITIGLFYRDWVRYREASTAAVHTREILTSTQTILSTVLDAETGQRGFLLTGDEKYLQPYYQAIQIASGETANLRRELVVERDAADAARIETLVDQKLAELRKTISIRRSGGLEAALDVVRTGVGQRLMDEIRQLCSRIETRQYSALIEGTLQAEQYARRTQLVTVLGSVILVLLLIAAGTMANRAVEMRDQSLQESREVRELMETTLRSIGDAVISTDAKGYIVFANQVARSLTGWADQDLTGMHLDEVFVIVNEHTRATVESPVAKVLREGGVVGLANHTILIARDGTETAIDDSGAPIRDKDGNIRGTVLVFRDITERRRAEETSQLLASIVASSDDAIISKDLNGIVTSWNAGAQRIFGYTPEEMIGQPVARLAPPDRLQEMPRILERIRSGERLEHFESVRRAKSGRLVNVSLTISPILNARGQIVGASKIARNITERKLAEEAVLQNAERLARSNAELQQFAYAASHDLQEPLRTIVSFSQLLVERCKGKLDPESEQFLEFVTAAAARMRALISDLLTYSRTVHREGTSLKEVALNEIVDVALFNLQFAIQESGAVVEVGKLPTVRADEPQMMQLFQNLISNAIKYRSEETPHIRITAGQNGEEWVISVADNGQGISSQYQDYIFGVFKRLHGREYAGTGVGLAICKSVVERHGGRIWVESEPGRGSTFKFSLATRGAACSGV